MGTKNKYQYLLVIQGDYGCGWEDLSEYDSRTERKDAYRDIREYRYASPGYPHRLINRRVINPDWDQLKSVELTCTRYKLRRFEYRYEGNLLDQPPHECPHCHVKIRAGVLVH